MIEAADAPVPADHPWQQTWYKPMGLVDVQAEDADLLPPDGSEPDNNNEPDTPEETDNADKNVLPPHVRALSESQRNALHQAWWASIMPLIGQGKRKVSAHFHELRTTVLNNAKRLWPAEGKGVVNRDLLGELLFDLSEADRRLLVRVNPLIRASMLLGGEQSMEDAAIAEGQKPEEASPFNIEDPNVTEALCDAPVPDQRHQRHACRTAAQPVR